ncbi:CoA transferase [Rhodococcus erythropolis]|uniref:CoA transferase n=1 Tax=Rhodococcus erythropolis TaxID=1833 RepID=UPI002949FA74|nr:CoA transferase [Rhodococcus erythropolis]MDV6212705.1 CoA transferase [Rhodococcus erythropolis]
MPGVLDGLRIIDFGQYIAGPLLAELLAQNGAEVVHVDPPGGPALVGLPDSWLNRGKKRITLDLQRKDDLQTASDLIRSADVVIENFRPGVMDRFGLDARRCRAIDPRLIYCSLPGFAHDDPRAPLAAWEGVVLSATAGYRRLREHWDWKARTNIKMDDAGRPLFTAIPMASTAAAMLGAFEVVTALLQREKTGVGARLEIPLSEAMLQIVGFHLEMPDFVGPRLDMPKPCLGSFRCADGRFIDHVSYPRFLEKLLTAAGVWDEWVAAGLGDILTVFGDPDLGARAERAFAELIATRTADEWESLAIELGIPFAAVRTPEEWLSHDHAHRSGAVVTVDDPEWGPVTMAGAALHASLNGTAITGRSTLDADRAEILEDLARCPASAPNTASGNARRTDDSPLSGVSVVEFSQVVAGPIAGRILADYGADVIKVSNPSPHGNNGFHGSYTNRGKRTVSFDLEDPDDNRILRAAVTDADVVIQNYALGAIERYGFGFDELRETNPNLVYLSMDAFTRFGPWRARRGHENQAVAATGLSFRYGGAGGWPIYQPYLISDVGTGIMGAFGVVLGLLHRRKGGAGQHISTSLSSIATLNQALYLFDGPECHSAAEPTGSDALGWSALQRLYRASDGWFFLGARRDRLEELADALGTSSADTDLSTHGATAAELEYHFRMGTRERWQALLAERGISVQPVREINDVAHDATWHDRGVLRYGVNGEGLDRSPILGFLPRPWPISPRSSADPGPLGIDTAAMRTELSSDFASTNQGVHNAQH